MKRFFILIPLALALSGCVTLIPSPLYQKSVSVSGSKDYLFNEAMKWMTKTFVSAKSVVQYSDKEGGLITGNGAINIVDPILTLAGAQSEVAYFSFTMEMKQDSVRFTFYNLYDQSKLFTSEAEIYSFESAQLSPIIQSYVNFVNSDSKF